MAQASDVFFFWEKDMEKLNRHRSYHIISFSLWLRSYFFWVNDELCGESQPDCQVLLTLMLIYWGLDGDFNGTVWDDRRWRWSQGWWRWWCPGNWIMNGWWWIIPGVSSWNVLDRSMTWDIFLVPKILGVICDIFSLKNHRFWCRNTIYYKVGFVDK